jgi:hypothetical protein
LSAPDAATYPDSAYSASQSNKTSSAIDDDRSAHWPVGQERAGASDCGHQCKDSGITVPSRHGSVDRRLVMSPSDQDDADKHMHAAPWAGGGERKDEKRRSREELLLEAAERLRREATKQPSQTGTTPPRQAVGFRLDDRESAEEMHRRVWAALEPELMSPPPRDKLPLGWVFVAGCFGAVIAAVVLAVANVVQIPSIGGGAFGKDGVGRGQASAFGDPSRVAASHAKVQPTDEPSSVLAGRTVLAAAPSSEILQPNSPTLQPPAPAALEPAQPKIAAPPAPAASPEPRPSPSLSSDEIAAFLKRGRDLIAAGDIPSARLVLTHAADARVAEASLAMAGTYDAAVLANIRVVGVQPDAAMARAWYERAAEQGSLEAKQRLSTLR